MLASIFYNPIYGIEKRIVIFQPSLSFTQVRIYLVRRNQASHGFAPFCNMVDCMIAQIAIESELLLLHNDRDFEAMAAVAALKFFDLLG